jgi:hypothetical protein
VLLTILHRALAKILTLVRVTIAAHLKDTDIVLQMNPFEKISARYLKHLQAVVHAKMPTMVPVKFLKLANTIVHFLRMIVQ